MRVYKCILENPGITSKEIMLMTGVQCPSGRISEIRDLGIKIISIGQRKFPGSKPFEMYKIEGEPLTKQVSTFHYDPVAHVMVEVKEIVNA